METRGSDGDGEKEEEEENPTRREREREKKKAGGNADGHRSGLNRAVSDWD